MDKGNKGKDKDMDVEMKDYRKDNQKDDAKSKKGERKNKEEELKICSSFTHRQIKKAKLLEVQISLFNRY